MCKSSSVALILFGVGTDLLNRHMRETWFFLICLNKENAKKKSILIHYHVIWLSYLILE